MDKTLIYAIIGGLVGAVVALLVSSYSVNTRNYGMMNMMGMGRGASYMMGANEASMDRMMEEMMHTDTGMSMNEMTQSLVSLEGEEFEKAFINAMIEHHQGAIDMANLIPSRTDRPELKKLGEDILSAQTKEVSLMQGWLRDWFSEE